MGPWVLINANWYNTIELADMFPDEAAAVAWFEKHIWPNGRHCTRCGSVETIEAHGDMPYWCPACRRYFSVRIGTAFERSKVPLRKWAYAIYRAYPVVTHTHYM